MPLYCMYFSYSNLIGACSDVEELENGDISYDDEGRLVNTVVTYECNSGFTLMHGVSMRTCTVDRTWVPSSAHTCELLYFCWCFMCCHVVNNITDS